MAIMQRSASREQKVDLPGYNLTSAETEDKPCSPLIREEDREVVNHELHGGNYP